MNEQKNNGRGIFYGVIGVATLVVAIIGATFAYFTASKEVSNVITGNMATVSLNLSVEKVVKADEQKGGMIPMSNGMVEAAIGADDPCVDDNGNAVCQIYKVTLENNSSAAQFVDGYVAIHDNYTSVPTDIAGVMDSSTPGGTLDTQIAYPESEYGPTSMRWAQVFKTGENYSTAGAQKIAEGINSELSALGNSANGKDQANIRFKNVNISETGDGVRGILKDQVVSGNTYSVIGTNFIRISNHVWATEGAQSFKRNNDSSSALVYSQNVQAGETSYYYFVVWLTETGVDQTVGADGAPAEDPLSFFGGVVSFMSAQGSEVSATFAGYTKVEPDTTAAVSGT